MKEPIVYSSTAEMLAFRRGKAGTVELVEYKPKPPRKTEDGEEPKRTRKKKVIRLYGVIKTTQRLRIYRKVNGYNRPATVEMDPGVLYELPEESILEQLTSQKTLIKRPTPDLERALKESGTPFEKKVCKVCGGKTIGIEYPKVEVLSV